MQVRKFKCIKKYPYSNMEIGDTITIKESEKYDLRNCTDYPEFWEEVLPKFKLEDIVFIFSQENPICKLIEEHESNWLVEFSNGNIELVHKCWSIKAANKDEIIQFYTEQGWKKGSQFKWDNDIWTISELKVNRDKSVSIKLNDSINVWVLIDHCELLPEQNVIENTYLSQIEKYLLNNNWEFRDEDYELEFYIKLPLDNELIFRDKKLFIRDVLFKTKTIILLNPTINQIDSLIKTLK